MDPYGIEKVQRNRYTDITGEDCYSSKKKNKRLIDSEQRLKKGKVSELA